MDQHQGPQGQDAGQLFDAVLDGLKPNALIGVRLHARRALFQIEEQMQALRATKGAEGEKQDPPSAGPSGLVPCPFCGESSGDLLAYGPSGETLETRKKMQATYCLRCGARGPVVKREDGAFTAAREAWNKRPRSIPEPSAAPPRGEAPEPPPFKSECEKCGRKYLYGTFLREQPCPFCQSEAQRAEPSPSHPPADQGGR